MNIKYNKKRLRFNFILGIIWLLITIAQVVWAKNNYWLIGWLIIGLLNFSQMAYLYFTPYITIKEGLLIVNNFLNESSINLSESTHIKTFAGDYIINADGKKLTVDTQIIEPTSLTALNAELYKFNIKLI